MRHEQGRGGRVQVMEMRLQRETPTGMMTRGRLSSVGVFLALTLEPALMMIPVGRYQVVNDISPHFQRVLPQLLYVPGRNAIEMHGDNTIADSRGCILLGLQRTPSGICSCDGAVSMVVRMIELARQRSERSYMTVSEAKKGMLDA